LRWLPVLASACMWKRSMVFMWVPLLWNCSMCMVSWMVPKGCASSCKCLAKFDV
jgi:hypothetical protein